MYFGFHAFRIRIGTNERDNTRYHFSAWNWSFESGFGPGYCILFALVPVNFIATTYFTSHHQFLIIFLVTPSIQAFIIHSVNSRTPTSLTLTPNILPGEVFVWTGYGRVIGADAASQRFSIPGTRAEVSLVCSREAQTKSLFGAFLSLNSHC